MPANFLSRNMVVDSISFDEDKIRDEQMLDPRLQALKKLLYSNTLQQYNSEDFRKLYQNYSFIDNGILYQRLRRTEEHDRVVLLFFFFKWAIHGLFLLYFRLFNTQLTGNKCSI